MERFLSIPSVKEIDSGNNTSVVADKLVNSGAIFNTLVEVGDIVTNSVTARTATVTAVDSATQLSLSLDIFTASPVAYIISRKNYGKPNLTIRINNLLSVTTEQSDSADYHIGVIQFATFSNAATYYLRYRVPQLDSGSSTAVGARKLIDSSADFVTAKVKAGDVVYYSYTYASVVSVDSATQLTLSNNIITATGQAYKIYGNKDFYGMNDLIQDSVLKLMRSKWDETVLVLDEFPSPVVEAVRS